MTNHGRHGNVGSFNSIKSTLTLPCVTRKQVFSDKPTGWCSLHFFYFLFFFGVFPLRVHDMLRCSHLVSGWLDCVIRGWTSFFRQFSKFELLETSLPLSASRRRQMLRSRTGWKLPEPFKSSRSAMVVLMLRRTSCLGICPTQEMSDKGARVSDAIHDDYVGAQPLGNQETRMLSSPVSQVCSTALDCSFTGVSLGLPLSSYGNGLRDRHSIVLSIMRRDP